MNRQKTESGGSASDFLQGWIHKWTNYLKGYQKRWFVLQDGKLSYYRTQKEIGHTCRGSINLEGATVHVEDAFNFVVSGGTQSFHLKAGNEVERQRWVTALELARVRAIKAAESDDEEELKLEQAEIEAEAKPDIQSALRFLQEKIRELSTCHDLIGKHASGLSKGIAEVESAQNNNDRSLGVKHVLERAKVMRVTTNAMITACNEFVVLASSHGKKWQRLLQHEHEQRVRLQEQLEALAQQHSALEKAAFKDMKGHGGHPPPAPAYVESDDDVVYHDAAEDVEDLYSVVSNRATNGEASEKEKRGVLERNESEQSSGALEDERLKEELLRARIVTRKTSAGGESPSPTTAKGSPSPSPSTGSVAAVPGASETVPVRKRRSSIPPKPTAGLSLWHIMKNCIGVELTKIPMPVNFNEPLSMLQRLTEDLEYSQILDRAVKAQSSCEQMCYVAAFTISSYSTTATRTGKPFNPLLGETFECDRREDYGWRSICEQVSHHPPAAAQLAEGESGWRLWQEFTMSSKFRGKYLSVIPMGIAHLEFPEGNHYTWRKVTTTIHNVIVGKLWIDNHGEMTIDNHKTGDKCHLKYIPYSYFSRDTPRKVSGIVTDKSGTVRFIIQGTWDERVEIAKVVKQTNQKGQGKPLFETTPPRLIWKRHPPLPKSETFYHFTKLAVELNEAEAGVAPTDSRFRPDQRKMEEGDFERANQLKLRLEEKQRAKRRQLEADLEKSLREGKPSKDYEPVWFKKSKDPQTGNYIHMYQNKYWEAKERGEWAGCPDIY